GERPERDVGEDPVTLLQHAGADRDEQRDPGRGAGPAVAAEPEEGETDGDEREADDQQLEPHPWGDAGGKRDGEHRGEDGRILAVRRRGRVVQVEVGAALEQRAGEGDVARVVAARERRRIEREEGEDEVEEENAREEGGCAGRREPPRDPAAYRRGSGV